MKRSLAIALLLITAVILLCGCCLAHSWEEATCTEPKTCTKCGKTDGEALRHDWEEATCIAPKTCARCGKTKGEVLEHTWSPATCTDPETCAVCGAVKGRPIDHDWSFATAEAPRTCKACGQTVGTPLSYTMVDVTGDSNSNFRDKDTPFQWVKTSKKIALCDKDNHELVSLAFGNSKRWNCSICTLAISTATTRDRKTWTVTLYDWEGNILCVKDGVPNTEQYCRIIALSDRVIMCYAGDYTPLFYYDVVARQEVSRPAYPFDETLYSYIYYSPVIDGFFVSLKDRSAWGFLDRDGKVLQMYMDASDFVSAGYALVSDDRIHYSILDKDFNVVAENVVEGDSAYREHDHIEITQDGKRTTCIYFD